MVAISVWIVFWLDAPRRSRDCVRFNWSREQNMKCFEQSWGLDAALYNTYLYYFLVNRLSKILMRALCQNTTTPFDNVIVIEWLYLFYVVTVSNISREKPHWTHEVVCVFVAAGGEERERGWGTTGEVETGPQEVGMNKDLYSLYFVFYKSWIIVHMA